MLPHLVMWNELKNVKFTLIIPVFSMKFQLYLQIRMFFVFLMVLIFK